MITVLLADDQQLFREGVRTILELQDDIVVVDEAADGHAAVELARHHRPDVVLLDIQMPGMDGLDVAEQMLSGARPPRVVMLTSFDLDEYLVRALRAGVSGFLLKDTPREQLVRAVRTVAAGEELIAADITRRLVEQYVGHQHDGDPALLRGLTDRERDVLQLVGRGLSNREVAAELFVGEATVKTHLGSVFSKRGLRDRAQAVVLAYEAGLVRPGRTE